MNEYERGLKNYKEATAPPIQDGNQCSKRMVTGSQGIMGTRNKVDKRLLLR